MKIGYAKIGRSMPLTLAGCGTVGGDNECASVALALARRYPDSQIVLIGRNSGEVPSEVGYPDNVVNPWVEWGPVLKKYVKENGLDGDLSVNQQLKLRDFYHELIDETARGLDQFVVWIGQHGSSNSPLPSVSDENKLTKPYTFSARYAAPTLLAINEWREADPVFREPCFLNADPRNYLKLRDLKWPFLRSTITQFTYEHPVKHWRGTFLHDVPPEPWYTQCRARQESHGVWKSRVRCRYRRLEINGLVPGTPVGDLIKFDHRWEDRRHFGLFINEAKADGIKSQLTRKEVMRRWVLPLKPTFVHGTWTYESQLELGITIDPAPWADYFPTLQSVRATFTTPSSGSGWATTKPWEAFAAGVVCFFHPDYDTQNNVLKDAPERLRSYLRVTSPIGLEQRVREVNEDRDQWLWITALQREHFEKAVRELDYVAAIEEHFGGVS